MTRTTLKRSRVKETVTETVFGKLRHTECLQPDHISPAVQRPREEGRAEAKSARSLEESGPELGLPQCEGGLVFQATGRTYLGVCCTSAHQR